MTQPSAHSDTPEQRVRRQLFLTQLGLRAEAVVRGFWPLWVVLLLVLAALLLGAAEAAPLEAFWAGVLLSVAGAAFGVWYAARHFRWPDQADAVARLDATLKHRPIAALKDRQAIGAGDAASERVWAAHQARMAAELDTARAVAPDLRLSRFDRYGLRYIALTLLAIGMLFGSFLRLDPFSARPGAGSEPLLGGPAWEGWLEPPAYTGRPGLYLNDQPPGALDLPAGTQVELRLYGAVGALAVSETVSGRTGELSSASALAQSFTVIQPGRIEILGPGGAAWDISLSPDAVPQIAPTGPVERDLSGEFRLPYQASDDYGVELARAVIALDLPAVDRRYGLTADPDARPDIDVMLPLPITGDRTAFAEELVEDFSKHPWAGLPVVVTLIAEDAAGGEGRSAPLALATLPDRRFFDPLSRALIEQRRDLLWARANGRRVTQILRAVSHKPEGLFQDETDYLRLRSIVREIEAELPGGLDPQVQQDMADALWDLALKIEEGDLSDALARLRRAQERLSEAMQNGASPEELARLMDELREAMGDYMRQLAQQMADDDEERDFADSQEMSGQQLEDLLSQLQQLMQQGRMAEAQQLLDQIGRMMENMQIARGQSQGQGGQGDMALNGLRQTLRDQQSLSDDAFRGMQGQGAQPGQQQGQGGPQGPGPSDRDGEGGDQGLAQDLADRQQALRDTLDSQRQALPGAGEGARAARDALEDAGRAMQDAEEALRDNDLATAMDSQAEAMDRLRDGIQELGRDLAQQQQGGGQDAQAMGEMGRNDRRDPLGREANGDGQPGSQERLLQDQDVYRRARDLLDEIRRRSGDQSRPEIELDYLRRLLDRF
ncbi:MAG: TIGR02302 family protein [Rhodobacteraceae bacterium]|nr:TIGR02302 family protein [Paracoccaceae bacterium]